MWYFGSPLIVFGDDALEYLHTIQGKRALIVTDSNIIKLGELSETIEAASGIKLDKDDMLTIG